MKEMLMKRRKLLGYSQRDVAKLVGIDRSYYSKVEAGLTPSVKVAKSIGAHLGIDWTLFFKEFSANIAQCEFSKEVAQ